MSTTHFDETRHARAVNGRFAPTHHAEPTGSLRISAGRGGQHDGPEYLDRLDEAERAVEEAREMLARAERLRSASALQALPGVVRHSYPDAVAISVDRYSYEVMAIHNLDGSTVEDDPANVIGWGTPADPDKVAGAVDWAQVIASGSTSVLDEGERLHVHLGQAADEGASLSGRLA